MTISESRTACASTHFRVQYPNSHPRRIRIFGLGKGGGAIARIIATRGLADVEVVTNDGDVKIDPTDVVAGITDGARELHLGLQKAEIIFLVAVAGDQVDFAIVVSRVARELGKLVTGVLIEKRNASSAESMATVSALRPCVDMLVIGSDETFLDEMLGELGATAP